MFLFSDFNTFFPSPADALLIGATLSKSLFKIMVSLFMMKIEFSTLSSLGNVTNSFLLSGNWTPPDALAIVSDEEKLTGDLGSLISG